MEATDDLNRAVETWQRVSELLPEDPLPWFEQGRLLVRLGELERAHEALDRCLEIRPDLDEARLEIGQLLFRQRKHAEALVVYEDLRRRNPGNARVLARGGLIHLSWPTNKSFTGATARSLKHLTPT